MTPEGALAAGSGSAVPDPPGTPAAGSESLDSALVGAAAELQQLERELTEIAMLEQQARTEATRHEQRRAQAAERLAALEARRETDPAALREAVAQLVTLTRRSALMESQVDVLAGKQKALARYRDHLAQLLAALRPSLEQVPAGGAGDRAEAEPPPAAVSRAVLSAQEDLRREIARAMHDGPAQSLANIVLQAQIVERLVPRDPDAALREARTLIEVVQHALDTTRTFIFNVRPMVLDDLGLVATLRRLARDRGREAQIPVDFDSDGADRRLDIDLETGIFRILDQAMAAYLETRPSRISLSLTWEPASLAVRLLSVHTAETVLERLAGGELPVGGPAGTGAGAAATGRREQGEDLPPALAAMIREQDADEAARAAAVQPAPPQGLPAGAWRDIEQRARSLGISADLSDEGRCLDLVAKLPG
ncbi:MAG: sensor histidine kinase [Candidatus Limnocylindrales bacterium]